MSGGGEDTVTQSCTWVFFNRNIISFFVRRTPDFTQLPRKTKIVASPSRGLESRGAPNSKKKINKNLDCSNKNKSASDNFIGDNKFEIELPSKERKNISVCLPRRGVLMPETKALKPPGR